MLFIIGNVLYAPEKKIYSHFVEWNVLYMFVSTIYNVRYSISLLIFCLVVLAIVVNEDLKPPTIIMLPMFPF